MIAIVGILIAFRNRPPSAWPYEIFSLNSVIALLAIFTRTALLSPVASCIGPRKWQWFLPSRKRGVLTESPERRFQDFETFEDSSRTLLGSLKFLWRINLRYAAGFLKAVSVIVSSS